MNERLVDKLKRLGEEAGIPSMTPEILYFALLVRKDAVSQWPTQPTQATNESETT